MTFAASAASVGIAASDPSVAFVVFLAFAVIVAWIALVSFGIGMVSSWVDHSGIVMAVVVDSSLDRTLSADLVSSLGRVVLDSKEHPDQRWLGGNHDMVELSYKLKFIILISKKNVNAKNMQIQELTVRCWSRCIVCMMSGSIV